MQFITSIMPSSASRLVPLDAGDGCRGPVFQQKPAIKQLDGGKKVLFECKIAADPKPQVTWFRDAVQLSDEGEVAVSYLDYNQQLFQVETTLTNCVVLNKVYRCSPI